VLRVLAQDDLDAPGPSLEVVGAARAGVVADGVAAAALEEGLRVDLAEAQPPEQHAVRIERVDLDLVGPHLPACLDHREGAPAEDGRIRLVEVLRERRDDVIRAHRLTVRKAHPLPDREPPADRGELGPRRCERGLDGAVGIDVDERVRQSTDDEKGLRIEPVEHG
jgi:hypothetical protein